MFFIDKDEYCNELRAPEHAQIEFSSDRQRAFNTTATYTCDRGSVLVRGDLTRKCRGDESWSGLEPRCYNEEEGNLIGS